MAGSNKDKNGNGKGDESVHYAPGDIVLGKIKGYPPWPGILCLEDSVPRRTVLSARPGKNYHIVRFFPAADYGFNRSHELRKLTRREIEAFLSDPHKRAADLREAYKLALDPEAWNEEQNEAVRQAEEEGDEEEDMLEGEEAEGEDDDGDQPVKKRKSTSSTNPARKSGATSNKKAKVESASASSTKASAAGQGHKEKKTSSSNAGAATSSPHKATPVEGETEEELDPETKKVKSWRYALQHAFLPRTGQIHAEEMERHNGTFKQVEEYHEITAKQLRLTKIGKVMKKIVELKSVPRDEEYHFRQRAQKLCDVWGHLLASGGVGSSSSSSKAKPESPVPATSTPASKPTNGSLEAHAKATSDETKSAEVGHAGSTEAPVAQKSEGSNGAETSAKPAEGGREEAPSTSTDSAPAAADESVLTQPPTKGDDQPVAV